MEILINDKIEKNLWNKFSGANTFHKFEWIEIINSSYKLEPYYIIAYQNEDFALLPAFKIRNNLISMPYLNMVGFLSNSEYMLKTLKEFIKSRSLKVYYKYATPNIHDNSTVTAMLKVDNIDSLWKNLSSKMRNQIRKSLKNNLKIRKENDINNFYDYYLLKPN